MNAHFAAEFISKYLYWIFLIILMINLTQRKQAVSGRNKRFATLFIAMLALALLVFSALLIQFDLPDLLLVPFVALIAGAAWYWRKKIFPFRLKCEACGAKLNWNRMMNYDDNLCDACAEKKEAGEKTAEDAGVDVHGNGGDDAAGNTGTDDEVNDGESSRPDDRDTR